jgi:hypothetical protein
MQHRRGTPRGQDLSGHLRETGHAGADCPPAGPSNFRKWPLSNSGERSALRKHGSSRFGPDRRAAWQPVDFATRLNLRLPTPRSIIFRAALD